MTLRIDRPIGSNRPSRRRSRVRPSRRRAAITFALAAVALVTQMYLAAHAVAHLSHPPSTDTVGQSCDLCVAGQSGLDLPRIAEAVGAHLELVTPEIASTPAPIQTPQRRALFARAPPSPVLTIG